MKRIVIDENNSQEENSYYTSAKGRDIFIAAAHQAAERLTIIHHKPLSLKLEFANGAEILTHGTKIPLNTETTRKLLTDKYLMMKHLRDAGIFTPRSHLITVNSKNFPPLGTMASSAAYKNIRKFVDEVGYPVFLKPNKGSQGKGVFCIHEQSTLDELLIRLVGQGRKQFMLQEACFGKEYRVIVVGKEIVLATEKRPLSVVGDGRLTIQELVADRLKTLHATGRKIELSATSPKIDIHLSKYGLSPAFILPAGQETTVISNNNLSDGATAIECTERIKDKHGAFCLAAAEKLGAQYCGIDLIENEHKGALRRTILEVNWRPGYSHFRKLSAANMVMVQDVLAATLTYAAELQVQTRHNAGINDNKHTQSEPPSRPNTIETQTANIGNMPGKVA